MSPPALRVLGGTSLHEAYGQLVSFPFHALLPLHSLLAHGSAGAALLCMWLGGDLMAKLAEMHVSCTTMHGVMS